MSTATISRDGHNLFSAPDLFQVHLMYWQPPCSKSLRAISDIYFCPKHHCPCSQKPGDADSRLPETELLAPYKSLTPVTIRVLGTFVWYTNTYKDDAQVMSFLMFPYYLHIIHLHDIIIATFHSNSGLAIVHVPRLLQSELSSHWLGQRPGCFSHDTTQWKEL